MEECTGWIVRSAAGRDKGGLLCVLGTDPQHRLLLADGKRRRVNHPKAKKGTHVEVLDRGYDHPAMEKLKQGQALTDKELRRALAAFRAKEV